MNGLARRRIAVVGLCFCIAGCAAHQLPRDPFGTETTDSTSPAATEASASSASPPNENNGAATANTTPVNNALESTVDHGPPPTSPYAKNSATAANTPTPNRAATPVAPNSATPSTPHRPASPAVADDAASLAKIMAELQAIGPLDPAIQSRLMDDLRQTDPALWPTLMQTFKAGIAYRQRATATAATTAPAATTTPPTPPVSTPSAPTIPASVISQLRNADSPSPFANLPLDALGGGGMTPRNGGSPGLALPTQTILQAAMAEAQRRDEEQSRVPPKISVSASLVKCDPDEAAAKPSKVELVAHTETKTETKSDAPTPTNPTSPNPPPGDAAWRESLGLVITGLETQTREAPHSAAEVSRHAWLRMLYLAAGRREDALKPIPGIAAAEQDFWSEQIYGLATYLDTEKLTDPARRSAEARSHLAKAEKRLSEASTLAVRSLAFCTEVSSYGVYERFKEYRFKAGQPLILYSEVENFRSEESAKGFHTALRSSYQILDPQGRRVAENDLALTEEFCQNERRDYFIRYFLSVPERIYDGKYTLQLTIVDTLSQKIGQSTIDFTVGEEKK
ncbi:MAG: hypothetical protein K8U03_05715 [Planctomycetia bacterium]|nr:hypothetical protein [Planctomycetia bacterium]